MMKITRAVLRLLAALLLSDAAFAQHSVFLEELTSSEVAGFVKDRKAVIVIPIGGTEPNGEHMTLGKHNARVRVLAERIAARVGGALVAPVVAYVPEGTIDPPSAHMKYAGTITVSEDVFEKTLESAARSFLKHGFVAVVLLGDHGGYQPSLRRVANRVNAPGKTVRALVPPGYYRELPHAGPEDTALTLATAPNLVRDPRGASLESGQAARDRIVDDTARSIRGALAR